MYRYSLCGMRVASEFPLPELQLCNDSPHSAPDLRFRHGAVPEHLDGADYVGKVFETRGNEYLLLIPGSARFLIRNGAEVVMQPAHGGCDVDAHALLSGPVQGVLYHQRGLFPLHASTVVQNGQAIALAGPSGTGKSTLAAALDAVGIPVIGDDICVVEPGPPAAPQVLPAYSKLRLWRDAVEALGLDAESLPRALSGKDKYLVDRGQAIPQTPLPLGHFVLLSRQRSRRETHIERLSGSAAMQAISANIHVRRPAGALKLQRSLFVNVARVASRACVWRLSYPDCISRLSEVVDAIRHLEKAHS